MTVERPFLIGLVCWVLIICGSVTFYVMMKKIAEPDFITFLHSFPYPAAVAGTIVFGTLVGFVVTGICMYEAQGWARYVYIAVAIPFFVQQTLTASYLKSAAALAKDPALAMKAASYNELLLEIKFVAFLISLVFLFLPQARRFFHPPMYVDE
jgi:hypothetical protein